MTQSPSRSKSSRSEATREAMLAAGRRLLLEEPASGAFSHLTATRVATAAGRTTGALFHQWPTLDDFLDDLLARMFDPSQSRTFDEFSARTVEVAASGGTLGDGVLAAGREALEVLPRDPHTVAELLAWSRACRDEQFRTRVAKLYPDLDRVGESSSGACSNSPGAKCVRPTLRKPSQPYAQESSRDSPSGQS